LYRLAPLSTWGIFTDGRDKKIAQRMLEVFGKQMLNIEAGEAKTAAPQIFVLPTQPPSNNILTLYASWT
jgi:hypothetical protein